MTDSLKVWFKTSHVLTYWQVRKRKKQEILCREANREINTD